jgi:hypothetical protein
MEPSSDQVVWFAAGTWGHVSMYLGLVAGTLRWDERADEHFAAACDFQERNEMLLWAAQAHLGWAESLASRGERDRAAKEASRSLSLAREHGYVTIEKRAAALVGADY